LSDFLTPVDDFLDEGSAPGMVARPDRPDRAAFMIAAEDQVSFTIVDASHRYAAGRALRASRTLADRTQRRLQLVIDSSIAFARRPRKSNSRRFLRRLRRRHIEQKRQRSISRMIAATCGARRGGTRSRNSPIWVRLPSQSLDYEKSSRSAVRTRAVHSPRV
jgi:hypothetical protein